METYNNGIVTSLSREEVNTISLGFIRRLSDLHALKIVVEVQNAITWAINALVLQVVADVGRSRVTGLDGTAPVSPEGHIQHLLGRASCKRLGGCGGKSEGAEGEEQ